MSDVSIYSYEDLRKKADDFLRIYNRAGAIPVPIGEIEFSINILPARSLHCR
jgi:hypothetical protein